MKKNELKNKTVKGFKLLDMNDTTYKLRKKVISIIYEAKKKGFNLPRIEVRIVNHESKTTICGYAYLDKQIIHINQEYISICEKKLTHIVLHEIIHAIRFDHDDNSYLMQPKLPDVIDIDKTWNSFKQYMDKVK